MREQAIVHIVDDDEAMLLSLQALLQASFLPTVTYRSAELFLEHAVWTVPGCLILDLRMPGMGGAGLLERLAAREEEPPPTIVLTAHGSIDDAVCAVRSGAVEFLEKPCPNDRLLDAVELAIDRDRDRLARRRQRSEVDARLASLTPRERDVLAEVMQGKSSAEIGKTLGLQSKSVQVYRSRLLAKLGYSSTIELVRSLLARDADRWGSKG